MLLNKIEFSNYRCFVNGEMEFKSDKPINLVLGINGSGKTELLYAIWYVLHSFDFKSLKAKENDPYSLNSQVYQRLQNDPSVYKEESKVVLTFEHNHNGVKRKYVLSRIEEFEKNKRNSKNQYLTLYTVENGEKSLLNQNQKAIEEIIEQIIPAKVLSGVMFDGERMMNLSSEDENSIKAIEGTIEDVTNLKLFTSLTADLKNLDSNYHKEIRKIGRKSSNKELEKVSNDILQLKEEYVKKNKTQETYREELPILERDIALLSSELKEFSEAKILESNRVNNKKFLDKAEKELDKIKNSLQDKEFKNISSMLTTRKLLQEVDNLVETNQLPKGLTSNAVENILMKPHCICGRPHTTETHKEMSELIRKLPPENLNALINEWVTDLKGLSNSKEKEIDEVLDSIKEKENEISELNVEINKLSMKIGNINNNDLKEKEKVKGEKEKLYLTNETKLNQLEKELTYLNSEIIRLTSKQTELSKSNKNSELIQKKIDFIKKAELMVKKIEEINMNRALEDINNYMSEAYKSISEDYPRGRRVYITQFIKEKYKLVSYYEKDLIDTQKSSEIALLRKKYKELDFDDPKQLKEAYIMDVATNNSTGQSKIMTMSFVKAILDYSSKNKQDEFSVKRQYPLVLDAPFSEISGDNLIKSAKNLHDFNEQIILLSDPNTYEPLQEYMSDNIGAIYYLDKVDGESSSNIRKG